MIKAFDIKFGQIHPEYFVTSDGSMYYGEVAYWPPGFKAFEPACSLGLAGRCLNRSAMKGRCLFYHRDTGIVVQHSD